MLRTGMDPKGFYNARECARQNILPCFCIVSPDNPAEVENIWVNPPSPTPPFSPFLPVWFYIITLNLSNEVKNILVGFFFICGNNLMLQHFLCRDV